MTSVEELKNQGNSLFSAGKFAEAVEMFSQAIASDSCNAVLYSNRSAAYASMKDWDSAVQDALKTVELRPEWGKGWSRLGAARQGLGELEDAIEAFQQGLAVDPNNDQLKKAFDSATAESTARHSPREFSNPFNRADLLDKLRGDARTAELLKDAEFAAKLGELRAHPERLNMHLQDPRMMSVLSVLLNVNLDSAFPSAEAKSEVPPEVKAGAKTEAKTGAKTTVVLTAEEEEAKGLKDEGNEAYKRKDFDKAIEMYEAALELTPSNPSLFLNQSAAHFEAGRFAASAAKAQEAIDCARLGEKPSDYSFYGRAFSRIATCYVKMDKLEEAIRFYNKSLTEHRNPETLARLRETEKSLEEQRKAALYNPELAEAARSEGNAHFKEGRWVEAVASYTEAVRRDERDPRAYSNRAACYLKLAAIPEGLKDCDRALQLDPGFIRAHIRRAALLFAKKEFADCMEACDRAVALDSDRKHAHEIDGIRSKAVFEIYRSNHQSSAASSASPEDQEQAIADKVARDPELASILNDPVMRMILQQMQTDPAAVQDHLKNPAVAAKIRKLVAAGVLRTA